MIKKKECVAMLLAGGQGSRLYALTDRTAKPAVSFGGKYRMIDLALSNCVNSGIDTVGVLTQYQPLALNDYIGNGLPWDLDRSFGGVKILPPYQGKGRSDWYRGTANAIYQNMEFIDRYDPKYVLILSGDHIYKMDYSKMLERHKESGADCTIAVIDVPLREASRFGIMSTDEEGRIAEFEEKPKQPRSTQASMGIYVFNKKLLFQYLERDAVDSSSSNDFGKNVIPAMLAEGEKMYTYRFDGYWRDVGTISSLWEANMDLLGEEPLLRLDDEHWRIYSRHEAHSPQFVGINAKIENCSITEGCRIEGTVRNSVLGAGVCIKKGAVVSDSVLMEGVTVEAGATVSYAILDEGAHVGADCRIGKEQKKGKGITVIGAGIHIPEGTQIGESKMIGSLEDIKREENI